jgi:ribonuclease P protein component
VCRSVSPEGESLSRIHRLRLRSDYLRCYRRGSKRRGTAATLHFHPNREGTARLGITASRKVGNAVHRHRLKRWAREIFRRFPRRGDLGSYDVVVHFWPAARETAFAAVRAELERLLSALAGAGAPRGPR